MAIVFTESKDEEIQQSIQHYERASGARINIDKSMVITKKKDRQQFPRLSWSRRMARLLDDSKRKHLHPGCKNRGSNQHSSKVQKAPSLPGRKKAWHLLLRTPKDPLRLFYWIFHAASNLQGSRDLFPFLTPRQGLHRKTQTPILRNLGLSPASSSAPLLASLMPLPQSLHNLLPSCSTLLVGRWVSALESFR